MTYLQAQFKRDNLAHNIVRLLLVCLLLFEILNIFKILHYSPQFTWRGLLSTSIITFLVLEVVAYLYYQRKEKKNLHSSVWVLTFLVIFFDFSADIFHLYARFTWWDQVLHFTSSALVCFIIFVIVSAFWLNAFHYKLMHRLDRLRLALFISATTALALGALYEVEEYTEDLLYHTQRSGLGTDTANDLSLNTLGILAMTWALWFILSRRRKKDNLI